MKFGNIDAACLSFRWEIGREMNLYFFSYSSHVFVATLPQVKHTLKWQIIYVIYFLQSMFWLNWSWINNLHVKTEQKILYVRFGFVEITLVAKLL